MKRSSLIVAAALTAAGLQGYASFPSMEYSAVGSAASASEEQTPVAAAVSGDEIPQETSSAAGKLSHRELDRKVRELEKAKDYESLAALDDSEIADPSFPFSRINVTLTPGYKARIALAAESGDPARLDAVVDMLAQESRQSVQTREKVSEIFKELIKTDSETAAAAMERIGLAVLGITPGGRDADGSILAQSCAIKYDVLINQALEANDSEKVKELVRNALNVRSAPRYLSQTTVTLNNLRNRLQNTPLNGEIIEIVESARKGEFLNREAQELFSKLGDAVKAKDQDKVHELVAQMRAQLPRLQTHGDAANVLAFADRLQLSYPEKTDGIELLLDLGKEYSSLETPNKHMLLDKIAQGLAHEIPMYLRRSASSRKRDSGEWREKIDRFLDYGADNICFTIRFSEIIPELKDAYPAAAVKALRAERDALAGLNALSAEEAAAFETSINAIASSIVEAETNAEYAAAFAKFADESENASGAVLLQRQQTLDSLYRRFASLAPRDVKPRSEAAQEWQKEHDAAFNAYRGAVESLNLQILFNREIDANQRSRAASQLANDYASRNNLEAVDALIERAKAENLDASLLNLFETSQYALRLERAYQNESSDAELAAIIEEGIEKSEDNRGVEERLISISARHAENEKNEALAMEILDRLIAAAAERVAREETERAESPAQGVAPVVVPEAGDFPAPRETANAQRLGKLKGIRSARLVNRAIADPNHDGLEAAVAEFAAEARESEAAATLAFLLYQQLWKRPKDENLRAYAIQLGEASVRASYVIAAGASGTASGAKRIASGQEIALMCRKAIFAHDAGDADACKALLAEVYDKLHTPDQFFSAGSEFARDLPEEALAFAGRALDVAKAEAEKAGTAGVPGKVNLAAWKSSAAALYDQAFRTLFSNAADDEEAFRAVADRYLVLIREEPELPKQRSFPGEAFAFEYPDVVLQTCQALAEITPAAQESAAEEGRAETTSAVEPLEAALKIMSAVRENTPEALGGAAALYNSLPQDVRGVTEGRFNALINAYLNENAVIKASAVTFDNSPVTRAPVVNIGKIKADPERVREVNEALGGAIKTLEDSANPDANKLLQTLRAVQFTAERRTTER